MGTCRLCGARLFEGSAFCLRCHAPIEATEEEIAAALTEIAAAGGRWRDPRRPAEGWAADPRHTGPRPPKVHSRRRRGDLSFSFPVKIAISFAVVLGVPLVFYSVASAYAIGPILIWWITLTPWTLRDLWKKTRLC